MNGTANRTHRSYVSGTIEQKRLAMAQERAAMARERAEWVARLAGAADPQAELAEARRKDFEAGKHHAMRMATYAIGLGIVLGTMSNVVFREL